jgi:hypothetical protein
LGYALACGDPDLFVDGTIVLVRHLDIAERVKLAYLAMLSLPESAAEAVVDATVPGRTFFPSARMPNPLDPRSPESDAQWWAGRATPRERYAYAAAAIRQMRPRQRANFLEAEASK